MAYHITGYNKPFGCLDDARNWYHEFTKKYETRKDFRSLCSLDGDTIYLGFGRDRQEVGYISVVSHKPHFRPFLRIECKL